MKTQRIVPVFQVSSLEAALRFYTDVLEFKEDFRFGNYAGLKLGEVHLHLTEQSKDGRDEYKKPLGSGIAYVFCDAVDDYYVRVSQKGAKTKYPPGDAPYGMREFMLVDLDGNHLAFGHDLDPT